jgi:hypothetical protein
LELSKEFRENAAACLKLSQEDWFERIKDVPSSKTKRSSFDLEKLAGQARAAKTGALTGSIPNPFQLTESASGAPALKRAANNNFKIQAVATTA